MPASHDALTLTFPARDAAEPPAEAPWPFTGLHYADPHDPAGLQAIQEQLQWRRKAALTCRQAAHEAAAAGQRSTYWELLALTEQLACLTFRGDAESQYRRQAGLAALQPAGRQ